MGTPKEHVEEIRRNKFSIGKERPNPLIEDLHQAVKNLSIELYTKDVHFLMELIQNAEDNLYSEGVNPSLEFIITSKDITATGAPATLLIFNNEKGFSPKNIESICSVGRSTKKGKRSSGYIGEKGIGFKSVFLVTTQPYIFSNGYQIRFNDKPCPQCGLGDIVPEWVEEKPILQDIKQIYGAGDDSLPTTTVVLPLKPDKVKPVKQQLSSIHPEVLLFLSKIRHLSVKEDNEDPNLNTVTAISISSEINFMTRKNMNAESYTLHLSAGENGSSEKECSYYMWKQKFPVRLENIVERRMDVEEWVVTLAFPNQERLHRGMSSPGVYSFLPTEMVTNFPFIIQADFVLASSRETILLDDKWNHGILECVPSAFVDAFKTLVIGSDQAPVSSLAQMFKFIPSDSSPYENLNCVREKIKAKLLEESIIPVETYNKQKHFCKPSEVGRLLPEFWNLLTEARGEGLYLHNLSSHDGSKILSSSLDVSQYNGVLNFLGLQQVKFDWYAKCIQGSNLVAGVSQ
ncbi:Sacsin protein [Spatholobus suberectus]|nr:Sacsin protein [Spatholobus suberectus]